MDQKENWQRLCELYEKLLNIRKSLMTGTLSVNKFWKVINQQNINSYQNSQLLAFTILLYIYKPFMVPLLYS